MDFFNPEISLHHLPAAETVSWQPVEKSYRIVRHITLLLVNPLLLIILLAVIYFVPWLSFSGNGLIIVACWLLYAVARHWLHEQSFPSLAYAVREQDILYKEGWLVERNYVCPFSRIQHCSIHSTPIDRKYGLATLTIYTAGSEGPSMIIAGLPEPDATLIREFIMQKIAGNE